MPAKCAKPHNVLYDYNTIDEKKSMKKNLKWIKKATVAFENEEEDEDKSIVGLVV